MLGAYTFTIHKWQIILFIHHHHERKLSIYKQGRGMMPQFTSEIIWIYTAPAAAFNKWIDQMKRQRCSYHRERQSLLLALSYFIKDSYFEGLFFSFFKIFGVNSMCIITRDLSANAHFVWGTGSCSRNLCRFYRHSLSPPKFHCCWQFPAWVQTRVPIGINCLGSW